MKKLVLMGQKGFNQLPEVGSELVVYKDAQTYLDGIPIYRMPKQLPCPNPNNHVTPFPELKFKNGDFERLKSQ